MGGSFIVVEKSTSAGSRPRQRFRASAGWNGEERPTFIQCQEIGVKLVRNRQEFGVSQSDYRSSEPGCHSGRQKGLCAVRSAAGDDAWAALSPNIADDAVEPLAKAIVPTRFPWSERAGRTDRCASTQFIDVGELTPNSSKVVDAVFADDLNSVG
jgi:hypothetical protein